MSAIAFVIFVCIVFLVGLGLTGMGAALFFVRRAARGDARTLAAIISLCMGFVMILLPLYGLHHIREANDLHEPEEHYLELDQSAICKSQKIGGVWRDTFEYGGVEYWEILPFADDVERFKGYSDYPEDLFSDERAVLNVGPKRSFLERVFGANDEETLYQTSGDCGVPMLAGCSRAFCERDQCLQAEKYYEDFRHYTAFESDYQYEVAETVDLDGKMLEELKKVKGPERRWQPEDELYGITCISSDRLFVCEFELMRGKTGWLLLTGEEEDGDDVENIYMELPGKDSSYFEEVLFRK